MGLGCNQDRSVLGSSCDFCPLLRVAWPGGGDGARASGQRGGAVRGPSAAHLQGRGRQAQATTTRHRYHTTHKPERANECVACSFGPCADFTWGHTHPLAICVCSEPKPPKLHVCVAVLALGMAIPADGAGGGRIAVPIEKDVVKAWMNFEERVDKMVRPLPSVRGHPQAHVNSSRACRLSRISAAHAPLLADDDVCVGCRVGSLGGR
jgi:hypothetical protein